MNNNPQEDTIINTIVFIGGNQHGGEVENAKEEEEELDMLNVIEQHYATNFGMSIGAHRDRDPSSDDSTSLQDANSTGKRTITASTTNDSSDNENENGLDNQVNQINRVGPNSCSKQVEDLKTNVNQQPLRGKEDLNCNTPSSINRDNENNECQKKDPDLQKKSSCVVQNSAQEECDRKKLYRDKMSQKSSSSSSSWHQDTDLELERALEQSRQAHGTTQPGAYAEAPTGGSTGDDRPPPITVSHEMAQSYHQVADMNPNNGIADSSVATLRTSSMFSNATSLQDDNDHDNLVVAEAVHEGQPARRLELPEAEEVDLEQQQQRRQRQQNRPVTRPNRKGLPNNRRILWCTMGWLLVVGLVVIIPTCVMLKSNTEVPRDNSNHGNNTNNNTASSSVLISTASPTTLHNTQVMSLLPDYTLEALADPASAQSRALQWLLDDPYLDDYVHVEWRVRQRFALATLFYATGGDQWFSNDNWTSYHFHECFWWTKTEFLPHSVFMIPNLYSKYENPCNETAPHVIDAHHENDEEHAAYKHLWFYSNNMHGTLPDEVYWLTSLKSFSAGGNFLTGTISSHLGQLTKLEALALQENKFSGTLPSELGALHDRLFFLEVNNNLLSSTIPTEVGQLSLMTIFIVDTNEFTGNIPSEIAGMKNLEVFWSSMTRMSGQIPSQIGQLTALKTLYLHIADFSGTIPTEVGLMTNLMNLGLFFNQLTGTIPTELGLLGTSFSALELEHNQLTGQIPSELGLLPNLEYILLQGNNLTGTIPMEILSQLDNVTDPASSITSAGRLQAINVTMNPFFDQQICWVDVPFFQQYKMYEDLVPLSCFYSCACPSNGGNNNGTYSAEDMENVENVVFLIP